MLDVSDVENRLAVFGFGNGQQGMYGARECSKTARVGSYVTAQLLLSGSILFATVCFLSFSFFFFFDADDFEVGSRSYL